MLSKNRSFLLLLISTVSLLHATGTPIAPQPSFAYVFENDLVVVEAEDLGTPANWSFETSHAGYTGRGYLRYTGSEQACAIVNSQGHVYGIDTVGACIGNHTEWIKIPVLVEQRGAYNVNVRNFHRTVPWQNDDFRNDATVWVHLSGMAPPVRMSHGDNANRWGWFSFGPGFPGTSGVNTFNIDKPGVYTFFLAGRWPGFCADRITIYRTIGPNQYPDECMSTTAAVSRKVDVNEATSLLRGIRDNSGHAAPGVIKRLAVSGTLVPQKGMSHADLRGRTLGWGPTPNQVHYRGLVIVTGPVTSR